MRRAVGILILFASTSASAQFAPQEWSADQDGANFICADVGYFQANNLVGSGTGFACTDSTGKLVRSATACVASGSAVSSVTGSGGLTCSPTTGAVICTLGSFTCPTGEFASASSTGGLSCSMPSYQTWVDGAFSPQPQEPATQAGAGLAVADDPSDAVTVLSLQPVIGASSCTNCTIGYDLFGRVISASSGTAGADALATYEVESSSHAPVNAVNMGLLPSGVREQTTSAGVATPLTYQCVATDIQFGAATGGGLAQSSSLTWVNATGEMFIVPGSATNGLDITAGSTGVVGLHIKNTTNSATGAVLQEMENSAGSLAYYGISPPSYSGFVPLNGGQAAFGAFGVPVSIFTQTSQPVIVYPNGIETVRFPAGGDEQFVNMVAPSSPGGGGLACYGDSTSLNIACKNSAGTVNHGVQTDTGTASQWIRAIADTGAVTKSQPAFTDVSGTETCGQSAGPYTGSVVKTANSCATKVVAIDESGGLNIPIGACTADGQAFVKVAGAMTCRLPTADLANDYTAPWVIGMHDGVSAQWTTSGTWAAGQILVTAASNHISTEATATCAQLPALTGDVTKASGSCATVVANVTCSALPALTGQVTKTAGSCATVIAPGVLTTSLAYYVAAVNPILGGGFLETSSSVSTLSSSDIPYPLGVAATTGRLRINILANSIVTSLGTGVITFTVFSNGVNNFSTTALTTVAAGTQVDTGLNSALGTTAVTDGWSVKITSTGTYVSGSITFTAVLVMGY